MSTNPFRELALWSLAHQDKPRRDELRAYHESRGDGPAFFDALSAQNKAWAHLPTQAQRQLAYAEHIRAAQAARDAAKERAA